MEGVWHLTHGEGVPSNRGGVASSSMEGVWYLTHGGRVPSNRGASFMEGVCHLIEREWHLAP